MEHNKLLAQLIIEIKKDLTLSHEMATLLTNERVALEQRDMTKLENITAEKAKIMHAMNNNQLARDKIQITLGAASGFAGLKNIIQKFNLTQQPVLKSIVQELETLLIKIQTMHLINSKIIALKQSQATRVINILYGREDTVYGENAAMHSISSGNTILKA